MFVKRTFFLSSTSLIVATLGLAEAAGPLGAQTIAVPDAFAVAAPAPVIETIAVPSAFAVAAQPVAPPAAVAPPTSFAPAPIAAPAVASTPLSPGANPFVQSMPVPVSAPIAAPAPLDPLANPFRPPAGAQAAAPAMTAPAAAFSLDLPQAEAVNEPAAERQDDEKALRYYASQRDLVRVGAEIRRLKARNPQWQPPADLFVTTTTVEEQPLWDLFAKGDYAAVRREVANLEAKTPGWKASGELLEKLANMETRALLLAKAARNDWAGVIATAAARPSLLVCTHMDVLWNVGEAFAKTADLARAYDLYAYVLGNCDSAEDRVATMQKATALLPAAGADALLAFARPLPDGTTEFQDARYDQLRIRMGKIAAHEPAAPIAPAELESFAAFIGATRSTRDAGLFGWYFYGQDQWASAAEWFRAASGLDPDPKLMEGYVLSLRNMEDLDAAEQLAYDNRTRSPDLTKIYIEIVSEKLTDPESVAVLDDAELARFETVARQSRSPLAAQAMGWYLVGQSELDDARDWFRDSVAWEPTEEAVIGLAVVAARSSESGALDKVKATYGKAFPALAEFESEPVEAVRAVASAPPRETGRPRAAGRRQASRPRASGESAMITQARQKYESGDYRGALAVLDQQGKGRHNSGAEIIRGWSNLHLGRFREARAVFKAEDQRRSTKDTRYGLGSVSMTQYGSWPTE